jgi:hypothetical protein
MKNSQKKNGLPEWINTSNPNWQDLIETEDVTPPEIFERARKRKSRSDCQWVAFRYKHQIELAKQTRIPLLAVQAELFRLYFRAWDKTAPIEFCNSTLRGLGFRAHDKIRALKILESAGWIAIKWRKRKSPLVTIREGFHLCL